MSSRWIGYGAALGVCLACTLIGIAMVPRFDLVNVVMVYMLGVVLVARYFARGPTIACTVVSVTTFDLLFVPPQGSLKVEDAEYLLTFAIMLAVGLSVSRLVESVRRGARAHAATELEAETERIRSTLLASISHDLRTPLAVMAGAASTLAEDEDRLDATQRKALARSIFDQATDMGERVAKLLQMTRLETQSLRPTCDWSSLAEIAAAALARLREALAHHRVIVEVPADLPLVYVDAALVEQALGNLLENAAKHTPPGTVVRLRIQADERRIVVSVEDYGGDPSLIDVEAIFRKFHSGAIERTTGGVGLGLAICRAIARLHGGDAWAERVAAGGMAFRFALPRMEAPTVPDERPDGETDAGPAHAARR
jgi:two-component system sensor histidine kinase KdpD